uniref:7TM_GPCR_Srx domain-containing protein n=1 Tax=Meloidogyne floridensis TaxID=298350 RepID=A0A915P7J7_9BILA
MVYSPKILVFLTSIAMFFRNFICNALIMERLLATIWVINYENNRSCWFTFIWVTVDVIINAYFFTNSSYSNNLLVTVIWQFIVSIIGIIEIYIFFKLLKYNNKVYFERKSSALDEQKLTGRYQLSENIRTTRQLIPTLCLHVCVNIIGGISVVLPYFNLVTSPFGILFCVNFLSFVPITYLTFLIELSMILYHPFLKRDFKKFIKNILICKNSKNNKITPEEQKSEDKDRLKDIRGGQLLINESGTLEADRHFQSIQAAWGTKILKNS